MSKKIKINIKGKDKPNLSLLFHEYLINNSYDSYAPYGDYSMMMDYYNDCYDDYDDDGCMVYPMYLNKKKRKNERYKSVLDYNYDDDEYCPHIIWFYLDFNNRSNRLEFNTLSEFSEYCDIHGYSVDDNMIDRLIYCYESHCCPSGEYDEYGLEKIMVEHSYGDMFYEVQKLYEC